MCEMSCFQEGNSGLRDSVESRSHIVRSFSLDAERMVSSINLEFQFNHSCSSQNTEPAKVDCRTLLIDSAPTATSIMKQDYNIFRSDQRWLVDKC